MIDPHIPQSTPGDGNAHHYDYEPTSPHFVEQAVQVYLRLSDDGSRWIVDGPSVDGRPLDSALSDHTAQRGECACHRPEECERAARYADQLPLPTAAELVTSSPTPSTNTKLQERGLAARPAPGARPASARPVWHPSRQRAACRRPKSVAPQPF